VIICFLCIKPALLNTVANIRSKHVGEGTYQSRAVEQCLQEIYNNISDFFLVINILYLQPWSSLSDLFELTNVWGKIRITSLFLYIFDVTSKH